MLRWQANYWSVGTGVERGQKSLRQSGLSLQRRVQAEDGGVKLVFLFIFSSK